MLDNGWSQDIFFIPMFFGTYRGIFILRTIDDRSKQHIRAEFCVPTPERPFGSFIELNQPTFKSTVLDARHEPYELRPHYTKAADREGS